MNATKELREQLGFSQEQMAGYLSITRGQLSMIELNRRSLPTDALIRLGMLERSLLAKKLQSSPKADAAIAARAKKNQKQLQKQLGNCNWQLTNLRYQLNNMLQQNEQCNKALHALAFLATNAPKGVLPQQDVLWMNFAELQILRKLEQCDAVAQAMLNHRINLLEHEVGEIEKLLK